MNKNIYWSINAKIINSRQLPTKDFLTLYRYKKTLSWGRIWRPTESHIFARCHEEWIFSLWVVLGPFPGASFDDVIKCFKRRPKNFWKMHKKVWRYGVSWKCVQQQQLLGVPAGCQLLVLLQCAKVGLDGMHYESWSTFFSLVPPGKEKNQFAKCSFLIFWKQVNECKTFPGCWVKNSYIFRN